LCNSGLDFTLVRCAWFTQNFSEGYLHEPIMQGMIALPAGQVREPIVDVDDIAEVAVAALTDDRHNGQLYEVTGPRLIDFAEAAAELSKATGRPIGYAPITLEQLSGQYKVSRERIRQIEVRAFEKLQGKMRELAREKGMMATA